MTTEIDREQLQASPAVAQKNGHASSNGDAAKLAERKVFIALPIYGGVDPLFFQCCMRLSQELMLEGIHGCLKPACGDSAIGRARNYLTREFLESDCTHLLFIDSDLVFGVDQIKRIMAHDEPIVGGLYCKKQEGTPQLVLNGLSEPQEPRQDSLQRVRYIGTGFIRVAREVFEKMIEVYGDEISYNRDDNHILEHDFWSFGVYKYKDGTKRYLSEDWYFCQRAIDLGFNVFADMAILLKHSGNAVFPLSYQEKRLYLRNPVTDSFDCPPDCADCVKEVFGSEYEFGINFETPPRVIDIGANAGAFSWWADFRWAGALITAYEPNPALYKYLNNNLSKIKGATAINAAVGDKQRNRLFMGEKTQLTCSQYRGQNQSETSIPITVIDPDELPDCDVMKIDTEGAEIDILSRLLRFPDYLLVEYHSQENRGTVLELMAGKMLMLGERAHAKDNGVMAFKKLEREA